MNDSVKIIYFFQVIVNISFYISITGLVVVGFYAYYELASGFDIFMMSVVYVVALFLLVYDKDILKRIAVEYRWK